uniref:Chemokine interleukin-8-like domain-containing protein n=1 Tax=Electrophorus electricus TaxID=8005 RepID=A0A4W4ERP3_ELEEL
MLCWNKKLCTLAVLLAICGCIGIASGNLRRPAKVGLVCCKAVSKAMIPSGIKLIGYKHQNALSPCVQAVLFFSETEKYCSDPTARWIPRKLKGSALTSIS